MGDINAEKRTRRVFGWLFLILFILWNALMMLALILMIQTTNNFMQAVNADAGSSAAAIGAESSFTFLIIVWALGSVVTGLLAFITRGNKTIATKRP